jgi:hypothetical protein
MRCQALQTIYGAALTTPGEASSAAITDKSESTCRRACAGSFSDAAQRSPGGLSRVDLEQGQPSCSR